MAQTVSVERVHRWHRPGLLCIGDAAHVMSPIGVRELRGRRASCFRFDYGRGRMGKELKSLSRIFLNEPAPLCGWAQSPNANGKPRPVLSRKKIRDATEEPITKLHSIGLLWDVHIDHEESEFPTVIIAHTFHNRFTELGAWL